MAKPTPQPPMGERVETEIGEDCDAVAEKLAPALRDLAVGCYALGPAMGLMKLAAELLYHYDKAGVSDFGMLAYQVMLKVRHAHNDPEELMLAGSEGGLVEAEPDEPPSMEQILSVVPGAELLAEIDLSKIHYAAQATIVFDSVPIRFYLNAATILEGGPMFSASIEGVERACFDVGFDPVAGRPQIAWDGPFPTSETLHRAVDVVVSAGHALFQHGQLMPFFKREDA